MLKTLLYCLIAITIMSFQKDKSIKDRLIGTWVFEKFDYPNYISPNSQEAKEANKSNKGLIITFTKENKFISSQINETTKSNNRTTTYKISKDSKYLTIGSERSLIDRLDETTLTLYIEGRPTITFKRKK